MIIYDEFARIDDRRLPNDWTPNYLKYFGRRRQHRSQSTSVANHRRFEI